MQRFHTLVHYVIHTTAVSTTMLAAALRLRGFRGGVFHVISHDVILCG